MSTQTLSYTCPHCNTPVNVIPHAEHELVTCPAEGCGKPFQVNVPVAVPAAQLIVDDAEQPVLIKGTADAQPPLLAENIADKEEELERFHLQMFTRYPFRCLGYIAWIAGACALAAVAGAYGWWWSAGLAGVVAGIGVVRVMIWWLRLHNTTLTLTSKRWVVESGVFSKVTTEIPLTEITDVQVNQDMSSRAFDVGDLILQGAQEKQFVLLGVPNPTRVADVMANAQKVANGQAKVVVT